MRAWSADVSPARETATNVMRILTLQQALSSVVCCQLWSEYRGSVAATAGRWIGTKMGSDLHIVARTVPRQCCLSLAMAIFHSI